MADGIESVFGIRNDVPNPGQAEEKEVVEGSEGAVGRESHGEGGQHVGSDRVLLLNISPQKFGSTSKGKLKWQVLGGGRDVNIHKKFVVSSDRRQIVLDNGDRAISLNN